MKKYFFIGILLIFILSGFFLYKSYFLKNEEKKIINNDNQSLVQPSRQAEINGYILNVEGNEITVANEIGVKQLTDEERKERQKLSPEERQALREKETANLKKENITLIIPVGIKIAKGAGDGSGKSILADMSELNKGVYVSIWKKGDEIEFIKLKGLSEK